MLKMIALYSFIVLAGLAGFGTYLTRHDSTCASMQVGSRYEGIRWLDQHKTIGHLYATCEEAKASYR